MKEDMADKYIEQVEEVFEEDCVVEEDAQYAACKYRDSNHYSSSLLMEGKSDPPHSSWNCCPEIILRVGF